jgi:hypothetical protein
MSPTSAANWNTEYTNPITFTASEYLCNRSTILTVNEIANRS